MEERTKIKTFLMPENGELKTRKQFDWYSFILTLASTGVIACIGFFFKIASMMAVIQEQHDQEKIWKDQIMQKINQMELGTRDTRDRVIGLEGKLSK